MIYQDIKPNGKTPHITPNNTQMDSSHITPHTRRHIKINLPKGWEKSQIEITSLETDEDLRYLLNNLGGFALERYGKYIVRCDNLSSGGEYDLVPPFKQSKNVHHH